MAQATPAVCEIDCCGVLAVGRCATCKRAFCGTHQAYNHQGRYTNQCSSCQAKQLAEEEERRRVAAIPRDYFLSGAARNDLITARVPTVEIRLRPGELRKEIKKKGLFRKQEEWVEGPPHIIRGWIVGEFDWQYEIVEDRSKDCPYKSVFGKCLTALLDIPPSGYGPSFYRYELDEVSMSNEYAPLHPIEPYSGGYQVLRDRYGIRSKPERFSGGWESAVQAVKRLIGEAK